MIFLSASKKIYYDMEKISDTYEKKVDMFIKSLENNISAGNSLVLQMLQTTIQFELHYLYLWTAHMDEIISLVENTYKSKDDILLPEDAEKGIATCQKEIGKCVSSMDALMNTVKN